MTDNKVYFLSKVEFLSDLSSPDLTELAGDFHWEEYAAGYDIVKQGQDHLRFYVLAEGKAEALVTRTGHNSWQVNSFGPGDAFGEISLFTDKPAPTTIRCLEKCRVLAMEADDFARMLMRWPKLYQKFIEKLSHSLNKVNYYVWEAKHREFMRSALQLTQYEDKFYGLWGSAKTTREVENKLAELARNHEHLLLVGERGTGRQMMAWYLHKGRYGEAAPFVVVDGRNFNQQWGDQILDAGEHDSQEFRSSSLLEIAEGGTLLIREIDMISPRAQLKLAQSLESRRENCLIVGSLIAEPELSPKLTPELRACFGQTYKITPLRERKRDIPVIAQGILEKLALKHKRKPPVLNQEATKLLLSHNYRQGNVTELIQVIERAFFLAEDDVIGLEHIFFGPTAQKIGRSVNLLSWPTLEKLFKQGTFVLWLQRITTAGFFGIILLLLLLPKTFLAATLFALVWGLWWPALTVLSPFIGRVWCTVCPFAAVMDYAQKKVHWNKPVPDLLKKYDYLIVTFLFLLIFWVEAVTGMRARPGYTVILLLSIQLAAILFGIIFTRHAWCHHLCPLGGFVGMASIGSMLEVRADATICLNKCTTHDCYRGTAKVSGCPMSQHAPYLDNNLACKLCFHCVQNCPNGAININLRVPAREVWHLVRVNQGYAVFIGVTLAILLPVTYFESLLSLQQWRLWFSLAYWGTAVIAGLLTWLIVQPFKTKAASRRIKLAFAFIPLVLTGHIMYRLRFVPGFHSLLLGLGLKNSDGKIQAVYIPALKLGQAAAIVIGLALTGFSVVIVLRHTNPGAKGETANQSLPMQTPSKGAGI